MNIANRAEEAGEVLDVTFTLPVSGVSQMTVLDKDRVIPVVNGRFSDRFEKFEVHAYAFTD